MHVLSFQGAVRSQRWLGPFSGVGRDAWVLAGARVPEASGCPRSFLLPAACSIYSVLLALRTTKEGSDTMPTCRGLGLEWVECCCLDRAKQQQGDEYFGHGSLAGQNRGWKERAGFPG